MYDQPHNDFDEHEHGEDTSSAAYDAERQAFADRLLENAALLKGVRNGH